MAEKILGPVGSMVGSVIAAGAAIGSAVVGAAATVFGAIKNSYTKLAANVPQNLSSLNSKNTQNTGDIVGGLYGGDNAIVNNVSSSYAGVSAPTQTSTESLVNSAEAYIPSDQLASLQSASKAISSNGPNPVKMPTAAVDTVDRTSSKAATAEIYGDSRISLPYSDSTTSKPPNAEILEQYNDLLAQLQVQEALKVENRIKQ
jgi:rRNA processing protein Gar1